MASLVSVAVTRLEEGQKGYNGVTLTNFANDTTEPGIAQGSVIEIAGALYEFTGPEPETVASWGGVGNGTQAYIEITAGGSTATAAWTTTPPSWDTDKQGFYRSSLVRTVGGSFKDGSGNATKKFLYSDPNLISLRKYGNGSVEIPGALEVVTGGVTVGAGGLTVTADGLTVTAGGLAVGAGGAEISGALDVAGYDIDCAAMTLTAGITCGLDIDMTGSDPDITSTKPIDLQKGHYHARLNQTGGDIDDVYDFLAPAIPDNGDSVVVHGVVGYGTNVQWHVTSAQRSTSTAIALYRVNLGSGITDGIASSTITDGDSTSIDFVQLAY